MRFKGTSQYAAYRWETSKIAGNPLERYFSIKIKALHPQDNATTIDDVADETFWQDGFIEFQFPASGCYEPGITPDGGNDNIFRRGVNGYCYSSSFWSKSTSENTKARHLVFSLPNADIAPNDVGYRYPLRLVKVSE